MGSGKDVYCEKPMTLTIEEGQKMVETCRQTRRIVQIGTQQRSETSFIKAIAMIRDGRIGTLKKATCVVNGAPTSPRIPEADPPKQLDWNLWLGPVPKVPYRFLAGDNGETKSWCAVHYEFRWWYEYSGGKLTDWVAPTTTTSPWGIGTDQPARFRSSRSATWPYHPSRTVTTARPTQRRLHLWPECRQVLRRRPGDRHQRRRQRHQVHRGRRLDLRQPRTTEGEAVDELKSKPLPDGVLEHVYKDRPVVDHFRNFFESWPRGRNRSPTCSAITGHFRPATSRASRCATELRDSLGRGPRGHRR